MSEDIGVFDQGDVHFVLKFLHFLGSDLERSIVPNGGSHDHDIHLRGMLQDDISHFVRRRYFLKMDSMGCGKGAGTRRPGIPLRRADRPPKQGRSPSCRSMDC